jgi:hypothetical protein
MSPPISTTCRVSCLQVRPDKLEYVPTSAGPNLPRWTQEERWKRLHREAYSDIEPISVPWSVGRDDRPGADGGREEGWEIVHFDPSRGTLEATDTTCSSASRTSRVRAAPDPSGKGRTLVDMRSISRVGGSDVGQECARIANIWKTLRKADAGRRTNRRSNVGTLVTRLFHVSDLHFGREDREAVQWFADTVRAEMPDAVICTGDLTMRAASANSRRPALISKHAVR